jgi:hypothetical protein
MPEQWESQPRHCSHQRAERTLRCLPLPSLPLQFFSLVRESQSRAPRKPCQHCETEEGGREKQSLQSCCSSNANRDRGRRESPFPCSGVSGPVGLELVHGERGLRLPAVDPLKRCSKALEYEYRVKITALGTLK